MKLSEGFVYAICGFCLGFCLGGATQPSLQLVAIPGLVCFAALAAFAVHRFREVADPFAGRRQRAALDRQYRLKQSGYPTGAKHGR